MTLENIKKEVSQIYDEEYARIRKVAEKSRRPITWKEVEADLVANVKNRLLDIIPLTIKTDVTSQIDNGELVITIKCEP